MNKAFVKESEDNGDRCPACGSMGRTVYRETIAAQVVEGASEDVADPAFFCSHATCDVAYFDRFERQIAIDQFVQPVYPKDPEAPICPCFGLTCAEIEADVDEGVVTRVKTHLERAQSKEARCWTQSPDGQSCVAAVQQYFMRLRGGA